jgi:hypothetical protein
MKNITKAIPEIFFIGLGISWAIESYFGSGSINYVAMLLVWLMFLQLIYKNRIAGLGYGIVLAFASVYFIFQAYTGLNTGIAAENTTVWLGFLGTSLVMAAGMLYNYATSKAMYSENELTISY